MGRLDPNTCWKASVQRWTAFAIAAVCLLVSATWVTGQVAAQTSRRQLARQANASAALHAAVLRSELEKHRSLPFVLAEDPDVKTVLRRDGGPGAAELDVKFENLSARTRAANIYLLNPDGITLAASNWRQPTSFVGSDYSFRPYFQDALKAGAAEHFALGTVSRRAGLYLARRVDGPEGVLGVIVVKVEFDGLEADWRASGEPVYVTDPDGVVLLTSVPAWRFHTLKGVAESERRRLNASLQFGREPLAPIPLRDVAHGQVEGSPAGETARFIVSVIPAATPGWNLNLLTPTDRAISQAVGSARAITLLLVAMLLLAAGMLLRRRERGAARAAAQEAARVELEARVEARTGELSTANKQLVREMEERRRAEASLLAMQDRLVQANKLATLGQIAAGVAHEINQPVAAIRAYADNAIVLLDRRRIVPVRQNLTVIASLTERIGLITNELRDFSRKSSGPPQPVDVEQVIAGAVLLIGSRARQQGVEIERNKPRSDVCVMAERGRLEQVLVNLLQNALEALTDTAEPRIQLTVQPAGRRVRITVADNGPGIAADTASNLFTPFVTTKATGLGLGLVISRDIVIEFGGDLTFKNRAEGGAVFVISLKKAS